MVKEQIILLADSRPGWLIQSVYTCSSGCIFDWGLRFIKHYWMLIDKEIQFQQTKQLTTVVSGLFINFLTKINPFNQN